MMFKESIELNTKKASIKPNTVADKSIKCPFCKTEQLKKENKVLGEKGNLLWFENKFPLFENDIYQTLILETNKCNHDFTNYSLEYAKEVLEFALEKREELKKTGLYKQVILFKNHGFYADSSIAHAHMQIVACKKPEYNEEKFEQHTYGPIVLSNDELTVTVSEIPYSEFYEFNVIWKKQQEKDKRKVDYIKWIQTIIRFFQVFKNGRFNTSYNLAFHETKDQYICKIIPRRANSVYFVGYGFHQSPNDVDQIAKDLHNFYQNDNH